MLSRTKKRRKFKDSFKNCIDGLTTDSGLSSQLYQCGSIRAAATSRHL